DLYGSRRLRLTLDGLLMTGSRRTGATVPGRRVSARRLAGELGDRDDDELRRQQRCKSDDDVDDAVFDVGLRRRLAVALHRERLAWRGTLEGTLVEQAEHEGVDADADRRPQRIG